MEKSVDWTGIEFRRAVGRELLAAGAVVPALILALGVVGLLSFGVPVTAAVLPALVIAFAIAEGALLVDVILRYRRATIRVGFDSNLLVFEAREGSKVVTGSVAFVDLKAIAFSPLARGGLEIRTRRGETLSLGPGLGQGSTFLTRMMDAIAKWASANGRTIEFRDMRVGGLFRYRMAEISGNSSAGA